MKKLNNDGMSLVEVIVGLALLSIFMVAVFIVLSFSNNLQYEVKYTSYASDVCDVIVGKIEDELESAEPAGSNKIVIDSNDGSCIDFYDKSGLHMYIKTVGIGDDALDKLEGATECTNRSGELIVHYREANTSATGENTSKYNWTFDKDMYMGFEITKLKFEIAPVYDGSGDKNPVAFSNVIAVNITLTHKETGFEYNSTRYIECYNYKEGIHDGLITYDSISL